MERFFEVSIHKSRIVESIKIALAKSLKIGNTVIGAGDTVYRKATQKASGDMRYILAMKNTKMAERENIIAKNILKLSQETPVNRHRNPTV